MRHSIVLAMLVPLLACAPGAPRGPAPNRTAEVTSLPCDVDEVLARKCRTCHVDPPINGAPMPLLTWQDTRRVSLEEPPKRIHERMSERIHHPTSPMPPPTSPTGPLTNDEMAILDAWLGAGAPEAPAGTTCALPDGGLPDAAPPMLPCGEPDHELNAFGSGPAGGFAVPEDAGNLYQCFVVDNPFADAEQATAIMPVIDDGSVHHIILYAMNAADVPAATFPCPAMPGPAEFVWGYAPGSTGLMMPDGIGLALPAPDAALVMQIHYYNLARRTDIDDASGARFCTTTTPRETMAGFVRLGAQGFAIPPRAVEHPVVGECEIPSGGPPFELTVMAAAPHMHQHGVSFDFDLVRDGRTESVLSLPAWDFMTQTLYDVTATIRPGDVLRTTCRYANASDTVVRNGEATEDEMCLDFVLVHPYAPVERAGRTRCVQTVE